MHNTGSTSSKIHQTSHFRLTSELYQQPIEFILSLFDLMMLPLDSNLFETARIDGFGNISVKLFFAAKREHLLNREVAKDLDSARHSRLWGT